MKINQPAVAGTLESGDVMIRIAPLDTQDIDLQINSSVEKQFGDAIRTTILDVLARYNVRGIPNFIVLRGGNVVHQHAGVVRRDEMRRWIENALS